MMIVIYKENREKDISQQVEEIFMVKHKNSTIVNIRKA